MKLGWTEAEEEEFRQMTRELHAIHTTKPVDVPAWLAKLADMSAFLKRIPLI